MSTNNTLVLVAIEVALSVNPNKLTNTKEIKIVKNSMVTPTHLMNPLDSNNPYKCPMPLINLLMWTPMMMM
jgi:predicted metal-dependent TIM-barrel fold hydrolase